MTLLRLALCSAAGLAAAFPARAAETRTEVTSEWRPGAVEINGDWRRKVFIRQTDLTAAEVMLGRRPLPTADRIVVPQAPASVTIPAIRWEPPSDQER